MNAVVFDLELIKRFKKGQPSEIVEIGACKVDPASKRVIDEFQIYISPKSGYIAKSTRTFINMGIEDVKNAVPFQVGIQEFSRWLGDDYYLCSWGKDDRLHFISQCVRNKISLDWFKNYNDIQQKIGKLLTGLKTQLGLKNALHLAGIEPTGKAHKGIDDARNTAELLIRHMDQIILERNILSVKDIHPPKKQKSRFHRKEPGVNKSNPHQTGQRKPSREKTGDYSASAAGSTTSTV